MRAATESHTPSFSSAALAYLPEQILKLKKGPLPGFSGRMERVGEAFDDDWTAAIFHPMFELWFVIAPIAWFGWKALRFAFRRLILNYTPTEQIKEK